MDSLQEIKTQSPEMDNNIISKSLSLDDQTRIDIVLLDNRYYNNKALILFLKVI